MLVANVQCLQTICFLTTIVQTPTRYNTAFVHDIVIQGMVDQVCHQIGSSNFVQMRCISPVVRLNEVLYLQRCIQQDNFRMRLGIGIQVTVEFFGVTIESVIFRYLNECAKHRKFQSVEVEAPLNECHRGFKAFFHGKRTLRISMPL